MISGLASALVTWLRSPEVHVRYTPSDEVLALRAEVEQLRGQVDKLQTQLTRAEVRYAQECIINLRLEDELRDHGVRRRR